MTGGLDRGLADVGWALLGSVLWAEGLPGRGTGLGITAPGVSAPRPGLKGRQVIPHTGTKPNHRYVTSTRAHRSEQVTTTAESTVSGVGRDRAFIRRDQNAHLHVA